jgi:hypothetical protein
MSLESIGSFVLVLGLATVFVLVLLLRQQRTQKDAAIWAVSGVVGLLLGAAGVSAAALGLGYELSLKPSPAPVGQSSTPSGGAGGMTGSGPGAGGMMGGGSGGGPGGGMGGMMAMMGGGGSRGPSPKRQLTTLVRKLELLTGDIAVAMTPDQSKAVRDLLADVMARDKLTDDEAKELHEKLLALLDENQQAKQEAIGLPFRRGGGGAGPGGGGPGDPGGAPPDPDANPFAEDENSNAAKKLTERLKPAGE